MANRIGWIFVLAAMLAPGALAGDLNVELMLVERYGEHRTGQPVTSGVPLPEGRFDDVSNLRLVDVNGEEVPCQFTPTVRWWRDRSVRWVLLDFQASISGNTLRPFHLRDDGPPKPIENPIAVTEDDDRITVDTGALRFGVRKNGFNLIDEAWVRTKNEDGTTGEQRIVKPDKPSGPVLWSNHPNLPAYRKYFASNDAECTVTVEERGPMRVVIKAVGRHRPDEPAGPDDKLLDHVTRIHAYRGKPYVRVVYSAECRQGESLNRFTPVNRWHLAIPGDLGDDLTYNFGTEGAPVTGTFGPAGETPKHDRAWLVCDDSESYTVGGAPTFHRRMGVMEGATKATKPFRLGYLDLSGEDRGIMVSVRWFWQNCPSGLFAHPNGSLQVAFLPAFFRKTPTLEGTNKDKQANFFPGMSKTHEMVLYFHGKRARLLELHAFCQSPLFARCRPEWYCEKTRAFGRLASSDPELYPPDRQWIVEAYDHFFEEARKDLLYRRNLNRGTDAYGMFNFGDAINHITSSRRDNWRERYARDDVHWSNIYYGFPHALIVQYARTGNLDLLDLAIESSMHLQDVDIHCWHPDPRMIGAAQYSAGLDHVRIYGRGNPVYASNTYNHYKNQSLFERYWLFGDRRALEIGLLSAGFARRHKRHAISQSRSIGHGIVGLLSAFETTLDTSYLDAAKDIVEKTRGFRRSRHGAWIDGIALEGHRAWYEVTGDKKAIETVLGGVDASYKRRSFAGAILHAYGFAYGQTGDRKYLDYGIRRLKQLARGRQRKTGGFGNNFRSTGYFFWYMTEDLPKEEKVPVFEW
ncbi:MAG: hypothetical protein ACOC8E_02225 [Planctomycetota bacterium]